MKKTLILFAFFVFISCSGIDTKDAPVSRITTFQPGPNDTLVSFVIDGINFTSGQKITLENAVNVARKNNITFDLAVVAEQFDKKMNKNVYKIYEDNQDIFEIIANGFNYVNPVEPKRTGEFFDITIKKEIPSYLQEEKIINMKGVFEKKKILTGMKIFLVPYYAGDENTILIAEKYGYKLIIQENIGKGVDFIRNYNTISASKCYVNIPNRSNITDSDLRHIKKKIQKLLDSRIKRIYIIFHPVNFTTAEALSYTDKVINEVNKFKSAMVIFGKINDGVM